MDYQDPQNNWNNQNANYSPSAYNQQPQQPSGYYPQKKQWPPMTLGNWIVTYLLMLIPIANIVLMFVWAFGSNVNPSKKTYFQASLIMAAIGIILSILLGAAIAQVLTSMLQGMSYSF